MIFLVAAILLAAPDEDFHSELDFSKLSHEEIKQVADEDVDAVCKILIREVLREADKRKIDAEVRSYLERSFYCWEEECRSATDQWKKGLGLSDDSEDPKSRRRRGRRDSDDDDESFSPIADDDESYSPIVNEIMRDEAEERLQILINERYFARFTEAKYGRLPIVGRVFQVIDNQSFLATVFDNEEQDEFLILISQVDTSQLADGDSLGESYFAERLWELDGTYRYETVGGTTKTVRKVKPYPLEMKKVLQAVDLFMFGKHLRAMEATCRDQLPNALIKSRQNSKYNRQWKDTTGQFSIVATFMGLVGDHVKLMKEDGKEIKVPLSKLSDDDKKWIDELK